jgi:hypothetical protein
MHPCRGDSFGRRQPSMQLNGFLFQTVSFDTAVIEGIESFSTGVDVSTELCAFGYADGMTAGQPISGEVYTNNLWSADGAIEMFPFTDDLPLFYNPGFFVIGGYPALMLITLRFSDWLQGGTIDLDFSSGHFGVNVPEVWAMLQEYRPERR